VPATFSFLEGRPPRRPRPRPGRARSAEREGHRTV